MIEDTRSEDEKAALLALYEQQIAAAAAILEEPSRPTATIHHPRCPTITSGLVTDCRCGGAGFPVRPSA